MADSDSKQETTTTSNVANYDRRVGVDGAGNLIAGEGATVSTISNDVSADAIAAAVNAQRDTADIAIRGNVAAAQAALDAGVESGNRALDSVDRTVDKTIDVIGESNARAAALASGVVEGNNALTETTRQGNISLVKDFLDKSADALSDQRQGADEAILNNAFKYGAYALTATVVALGGFLIFANRKK